MNKLDSSTDPEVLGSPLDLNRPELRGVLKRYVSRSALIVGRSLDEAADLKTALLDDGWLITSCDGPAHVRCPRSGEGIPAPRESAPMSP